MKIKTAALAALVLFTPVAQASICSRALAGMDNAVSWMLGPSPFGGDWTPGRVPLFDAERTTEPFPHIWNYKEPLEILGGYFRGADELEGGARHNRYLKVPFVAPFLVSRDYYLTRAITTDTGDKPGEFDRDQMAIRSISNNIGADTLLNVNRQRWRDQKVAAASPFGKTGLFSEEVFQEFEGTFRATMSNRVEKLMARLRAQGTEQHRAQLEPEIKAAMLEMLSNNFFGAEIPYTRIRNEFMPALEVSIDSMVRGQVVNPFLLPPAWFRSAREKDAFELYDELTALCLKGRPKKAGLWKRFTWEGPDEVLVPNIKAFLAGALEATTSYASWAISHLSRHPEIQEKLYQELKDIDIYSPDALKGATYLAKVLKETLRLTPSLYFLPRTPAEDKWVEMADGKKMFIPGGTHIFLDIWHLNRHEDHWGVAATGYPALAYVPERWDEENMKAHGRGSKDNLHFGFGHGPRMCPGVHLGELEVALAVGAFVKYFKFSAVNPAVEARAGVSTKPGDGVDIILQLRP